MAVVKTRAQLSAARHSLDLAVAEFEETPARHRHPEVIILNAKVKAVRAQLEAVQAEALEARRSVLRREGKSEAVIARVR